MVAKHLFNVREYYRLGETGILTSDEPVELIEGVIMEMHPTTQRLFTVDEFHRMGETGIFSTDDRVELIEGEIIHMPPIGSYHASHVNRLNMLLYPHIAKMAIIRVQSHIELTNHSEPQPDLVLKVEDMLG